MRDSTPSFNLLGIKLPEQVTPESPRPDAARSIRQSSLAALGLSALGIVFGDIGTSPLYTLKTVLALSGSTPAPNAVLGVLSLILWTLIIITSVKYVIFAMSIDNDGEGGILALMSLLGIKKHHRPTIIAIGLFGAALIYGDGAITPAIMSCPQQAMAWPVATGSLTLVRFSVAIGRKSFT